MFITHDYYCSNCDKTEELLVDREEVDSQQCQECSSKLERQLSATYGKVVGTHTPATYVRKR